MKMQTAIETVFLEQWQLLDEQQKELLLNIALNFNRTGDQGLVSADIPAEHWEKINREREAHLSGSKSYNWDDIKKMAKNKESRDDLSSRD